jgi:hypothetical protein
MVGDFWKKAINRRLGAVMAFFLSTAEADVNKGQKGQERPKLWVAEVLYVLSAGQAA